jgi:hypothetical protein
MTPPGHGKPATALDQTDIEADRARGTRSSRFGIDGNPIATRRQAHRGHE